MKRFSIALTVLAVSALTFGVTANAGTWVVPDDFATVQDAIDSPSVEDGDTIRLAPGNHAGAIVTKQVAIIGEGGATINDGPLHPAGLTMGFRLMGSSGGTTISHLRFTVDLDIMNGAAVDDVTVTQCTFENALQGVSNWRGSGWDISHNKFFDLRTQNGGGIAILIADYTGGVVTDNVVAHNKIMGTLQVWESDGGGYQGSGIVMYGDFRWGRAGVADMSGNRVVKNKISMESDTPSLVDIVAFELTDTADPLQGCGIINDNAIGFNDFRGTALQVALTPGDLDTCNSLSRNLGDNRGQGLHPQAFRAND